LDAGSTDEAKNQLEEVLHVSPGNALAKSLLGRVLIAEGDQASGRRLLEEALVLWSDADDELIYAQEARDALAALGTG
ncbi:MAG: tetratricopeptide repeat protein, partial [Woeseiaceae bacterium]